MRLWRIRVVVILIVTVTISPLAAAMTEVDAVPGSAQTERTVDVASPVVVEKTTENGMLENPTQQATTSVSVVPTAPHVDASPAAPESASAVVQILPIVPVTPPVLANSVIITEVQTYGVNASTEMISLFNASSQPVDMTDWCLEKAAAASESYTKMACIIASDSHPATRVLLPPQTYAIAISRATQEIYPTMMPDVVFASGLSNDGGRVRLVRADKTVADLVGWTKDPKQFVGISPAPALPDVQPPISLVRKIVADTYQNTGQNNQDFHLAPATLTYPPNGLYEVRDICSNLLGIQGVPPDGWVAMPNGQCIDQSTINYCDSIVISEIGANLPTDEQFIELHNTSMAARELTGCQIMTNRSNTKKYVFDHLTLEAGGFFALKITDTELVLTRTTTGTVFLLDSAGSEIDEVYYEKLSTNTSWALVDNDWRQTYQLTPGEVNMWEKWPACGEGYWRNEDTGRCNKIVLPSPPEPCGPNQYRAEDTGRCRNNPTPFVPVPCKEGQYRSEETGRCRSIALAAQALKPCADDEFRNPATNRCKKIAADSDVLKECAEGFERNPATNRCRKVLAASTQNTDFAPEKVAQVAGSTLGWWVLGGASLLALGYGVWEWRWEISRLIRRSHSPTSSK